MKATNQMKQEALEYYRQNADGYTSVKQYVEIDYKHFLDKKERENIIRYIKKHI